MGMLDSSIYNARLLGWCLLFSAVNGAIVFGAIGLGGAPFPWYEGVVGGALFGPLLTVLFETPARALVRGLAQIPYCGWVFVLTLVALRFLLSWPGVMVANHVMTSRSAVVVDPPARGPARPPAQPSPPVPPASPPAVVGNGCPHCNGRAMFSNGDGKCARCHGTGKVGDIMSAMAASLSNQSQDCGQCGGSGRCTTCGGKGYLR